jgi:carbonic anhydrase
MSVIDEVYAYNQAHSHDVALEAIPGRPARQIAIISCMDCRMQVERILGLQPGDAHIIRNAGGVVTEDVLRSLIISHHLQGVEEIMIINHTGCGMMAFHDEELRLKLQTLTGTAAITPTGFWAFRHLETHVREQIQKLTSHPWIPDTLPIRGFVYDVKTGDLTEVSAQTTLE